MSLPEILLIMLFSSLLETNFTRFSYRVIMTTKFFVLFFISKYVQHQVG